METRTYDAGGRLSTVTNAIGVTTTYAYYDNGLAKQITAFREHGQTDRIDEIVHRLAPLLAGPEAGVLAAQQLLTLASFESLRHAAIFFSAALPP